MCGISGEVRLDGQAADVEAVARMTGALHRRGPDGEGVWSAGRVALGHRRLKVVDLSECAQQPMVDPYLGLTGVFNGMVYNYRELRAELEGKGHRFFSEGDTEVVLKAYAEWGEAFPEHLSGMFAVVLVERDSGRVVMARDRLGIKPLYLAETPGRLRFASTLPALLAAGDVDTTVDPVALHHYLTFHAVVPAPRTVLNGVRKLPPATVRVVEPDGSTRESVYWSPSYVRDPARAGMSARDWEDAVLEALRTSVPPADGRRRRGRRPAVRRRRLLARRRAARRAGPAGAQDVQHRLRGGRRRRGRRVPLQRPRRRSASAPTTPG